MFVLKRVTAAIVMASSAVLVAVAPASANTITIAGDAGSLTCNGAEIGACEAIVGGGLIVASPGNQVIGGIAGTFSATAADEFDIGNSSASNEAAALDILAGASFGGGGGAYDFEQTLGSGGAENSPDDVFISFAQYVVLKLGARHIFLHNISGGMLSIAYDATPGAGSGLSHYSQFGQVSAVPLPAALWLMAAGIAGLGFAAGRPKSHY